MMRLSAWIIALLLVQPTSAQDISNQPNTFHRLLIFNEHGELLVVKIQGRDLWVTPGWYQDNQLTIQQGLEALTKSYGLTTGTPKLRGLFTLQMGDDQNISTRLIYSVVSLGGDILCPEGIDEVRWLEVSDALEVLTLPHIKYQLEQIVTYPTTVWGGSQHMFLENGVNKMNVLEPFYALFPTTG